MGYVTTQGQTWDMIAKDVYDDELLAGYLMESNPKYINILTFPTGIELVTPELADKNQTDLPPWR